MSSLKKKFSFKRDHKVSDAATNGSFVDGPVTTFSTQQPNSRGQKKHKVIDAMAPNKVLEGKVLQYCFEFLSRNLPPDDVAIEMNTKSLLTVKEHEEYLSMKRVHTSDSTKSEYLLQCLRRRRAGFLTRFCEILREIDQASYLADEITEAYKRIALQNHGHDSRLGSRDRLSNLSLSDSDLHAKVEYSAHECAWCKVLERRNKKLERECAKLKEQQDAYHNILSFMPLAEVAQDQLHRAMSEGNRLKQLLPSLQEAVTETTSKMSAIQLSLGKMNEMLAQKQGRVKEKKAEQAGRILSEGHSARDSIISESSAYTAESETGHFHTKQICEPHSPPASVSTRISLHQGEYYQTNHRQEITEELSESQAIFREPKFRSHRRKSESATALQKRQKFQQTRDTRSEEDPKSTGFDMDELRSILKSRREYVDGTSNTDT